MLKHGLVNNKADVVQSTIQTSPMLPFQISAVAICLFINFLDGFDALAIAFAAPEIAREWNVDAASLGIIFSVGLAGMVLGALFLSPQADRFGRRPVIIACLTVIGLGMLASAVAESVIQLIITRAITGFGVGGMLASLTTMVAEYSNDKHRQFAISVLQSGYPIGAVIAGIASAVLLQHYSWRSIFIVGGTLSLAMIPIVYWRLPESVEFLIQRRPRNALQRLNAILPKMGHAQLVELPARPDFSWKNGGVTILLERKYRARTLCIWFAFVALMSAFYFVTNWTPKILIDAGLSQNQGISGAVLIAIGGVFGGLTLGALTRKFLVMNIGVLYMVLGITAMIVFGALELNLSTMLPVAFFVGFFVAGSIICLYVILPSLYPTQIRNTGVGWALGIGRLGAVIGPYLAGLLIAYGWEREHLYLFLSIPILVSVAAIIFIKRIKFTESG